MFLYKAQHPSTLQIKSESFFTISEAKKFAIENLHDYPKYEIKHAFNIVDGIMIDNDPSFYEDEDENPETQ